MESSERDETYYFLQWRGKGAERWVAEDELDSTSHFATLDGARKRLEEFSEVLLSVYDFQIVKRRKIIVDEVVT